MTEDKHYVCPDCGPHVVAMDGECATCGQQFTVEECDRDVELEIKYE